MQKQQLNKIAQSYTNKKYLDREESVKASEEIVNTILNNLSEYQEAYGITDIADLVEAVSNDVVEQL